LNQQPKSWNLVFLLLVMVLALVLFSGVLSENEAPKELSYSDVVTLFREEKVDSFVLKGSSLTMQLKKEQDGSKTASAELGDTDLFHSDLDALIASQYKAGVLRSYDYQPAPSAPWYKTILPYLLIGAALLLLWYYLMNKANGGPAGMAKFTRANARFGTMGRERVSFDDVAGADEEKAELQELVDFLRDPKRFSEMGARIPKGVLLVGPPGTGKTLLAKAVAGEAGVAFLSISGSDFVELYVGVGASRVRDLFEQAKKVSPCIVFIDEIDAVGRQRGAGLGGGHDEREQTLNQLLVEMDGFGKNEGVIVLAATNRKDILDPALLRPGRFDRQIYVGTPDRAGREAILKVHSKDKPLADNVELGALAGQTAGFTGADLANLLNEGALLAARRGRKVITMKDLEDAMIKVIAGPEKRSRVVPERERRLTAFHEAGHAVAMYRLPTQDPVHKITIIPRGQTGGMTISLPSEDESYASRGEMFERIVSLLGGRVAEQLRLEDISTGAANDIQRATAIARDMVARYGMSERLGPVSYTSDSEVFIGRDYEKTKAYSEKIAGDIDDEVRGILREAYGRCERILNENADQLDAVAAFLLEHDTMTGPEFSAVMEGRELPKPDEPAAFEVRKAEE
jgi:cell division protease FtsH